MVFQAGQWLQLSKQKRLAVLEFLSQNNFWWLEK